MELNLELTEFEVEAFEGDLDGLIAQSRENYVGNDPSLVFVNGWGCLTTAPALLALPELVEVAVFHCAWDRNQARLVALTRSLAEDESQSWETYPVGLMVPALLHHSDTHYGLTGVVAMLELIAKRTLRNGSASATR